MYGPGSRATGMKIAAVVKDVMRRQSSTDQAAKLDRDDLIMIGLNFVELSPVRTRRLLKKSVKSILIT
jgi:hypothetical protein